MRSLTKNEFAQNDKNAKLAYVITTIRSSYNIIVKITVHGVDFYMIVDMYYCRKYSTKV